MSEPRTDPVWLDDVESPRGPAAPRRLCIISGDALPSGEFIAALQTAIGPNEEIEIIRDRRRGGPAPAPGRLGEDRRRLSNVDTLMKLDGFAIVPASATPPRPGRTPEPSFADSPSSVRESRSVRESSEPAAARTSSEP
jgi:hypothetical protein